MRKTRQLFLSVAGLLLGIASGAQNLTDLRIGEVLCENNSGLIDESVSYTHLTLPTKRIV